MSLSKAQVDDIQARFKAGETAAELAKEFDVSESAVRYHLKKSGPSTEPEHDAEHPSDAELGIGEEESAASDALAAMMANPKFTALLETAVAAKMAEFGSAAGASGEGQNSVVVAALKELSKSFERSLEIQASQQPGYTKPIPREVVESRAAGYVEMLALIKEYKAAGTPPTYILGDEGFHGPSVNGPTLYLAGSEVDVYLPPAESFRPINEQARKVYAAMLQWIGGPSPEIGDRLVEAHAEAKRVVIGGDDAQPRASVVTLRAPPKEDLNPLKRHAMAHMLTENPNNLPPVPGLSHPARAPVASQRANVG